MAIKTILLVDDNEHDIFLAERALKKNNVGDRIIVARDGVEALDYLLGQTDKEDGETPSVVLLDLKMPKLGGVEVLRKMRANPATRYLPVVVLTASREDSDRLQSYASGCNAYVAKPIDFQEFSEAVKNIGEFWLALNQTPAR
ncbi:MAG: response regulator [Chloroflexi bacterium]|nr:response regulator [Chloroflexota bacterium]